MITILNSLLYWIGVEVVSTGKREADAMEIDAIEWSDFDADLECDWTEDCPYDWSANETFELMECCYYDGVDSMTGKVQELSFALLIGTTLNILLVCYIAASVAANS